MILVRKILFLFVLDRIEAQSNLVLYLTCWKLIFSIFQIYYRKYLRLNPAIKQPSLVLKLS